MSKKVFKSDGCISIIKHFLGQLPSRLYGRNLRRFVSSAYKEDWLITISSISETRDTHVSRRFAHSCQHFAIRNTFSSRCIRHTSFLHLIHHDAATALGSASPCRRKCSLLHVKVRSGCQHGTTNVRLARAAPTWRRQRLRERERRDARKLIIAGAITPSAREENICETSQSAPALDSTTCAVATRRVASRRCCSRKYVNTPLSEWQTLPRESETSSAYLRRGGY